MLGFGGGLGVFDEGFDGGIGRNGAIDRDFFGEFQCGCVFNSTTLV